MTVTRIGLEDGLGVMVLVPTGIGVAFTLLLLEWHVLHDENGMLSHVATALEVTTGVPPGTGVAVAIATAAEVTYGTGDASTASRGVMNLYVWLPPSCTTPRLMVVGGMWHWMHLPLWTPGAPGTSMAP